MKSTRKQYQAQWQKRKRRLLRLERLSVQLAKLIREIVKEKTT